MGMPAWALVPNGVTNSVHYLDDFLFWSAPGSPDCLRALNLALQLGCILNLPAALEKVESRSSSLTFLRIEIDTVARQLRLPTNKLQQLKRTLANWSNTKNPTKRQLQSLIRLLNHVASVVPPDRMFMHDLIENMKRPTFLDQRTRFTAGAKEDIAGWFMFTDGWNGVGFFPRLTMNPSPRWWSPMPQVGGAVGQSQQTPSSFFS